MMATAFNAVTVTVVLVGLWLAIQRLWSRVSGSHCTDPLAGRLGCHNCQCQLKQQDITDTPAN